MSHFGIITPPVSGHIHPFAALGRELIARGHRVTCFQVLDLEQKIKAEGLEYVPIGQTDHPLGSLPRSLAELGRRGGNSALRFTIRAVARTSEMLCRDGPEAIATSGVDGLLVDQMEPAGGAVAEHLGLPFVTVCNALPINRDPVAPPPFTPWRYQSGAWARIRNKIGYKTSDWVTRPISKVVARHRAAWRLRPLASPDESFSTLAQLSQMPRELDFPREELPKTFHYVGPLRRPSGNEPRFPWERLNGRPVVYASLGTLQNNREPLFRCIAEACKGLDVQLVISHGGGLNEQQASSLSGEALVVGYAPQVDLLAKAVLTITHAGLNTVLDSLTQGVPLVVIPITYEQPAIARRVERSGTGQVLPLKQANSSALRRLVLTSLNGSRYHRAAGDVAAAIRRTGGVERAANLVEDAIGTGQTR